jgi:hypothetical protein
MCYWRISTGITESQGNGKCITDDSFHGETFTLFMCLFVFKKKIGFYQLRRGCKRTVGYLSRRYEEDNNAAFWRGCIPLISFSSFAHEHIYIYIIAKYLFYIRPLKLYGIIIYNILSFVVLYFSAKWINHFCFCFFFESSEIDLFNLEKEYSKEVNFYCFTHILILERSFTIFYVKICTTKSKCTPFMLVLIYIHNIFVLSFRDCITLVFITVKSYENLWFN